MSKNYYEYGERVAKMAEPQRQRICEAVKKSIQQQVEKGIDQLRLKGSLIKEKLDALKAEIAKDQQEGISDTAHVSSYHRGILLILGSIPMIAGDFFLTHMTLEPMEIGWEGYIIAGVVMLGAIYAFDQYFSYCKRLLPSSYTLFLLTVSFIAAVSLLVGIALLAEVRGGLLETLRVIGSGSPEDALERIKTFQSGSQSIFSWAILFVTIGLTFVCSICLHEGLERVHVYKVSPVKKKRTLSILEEQLLAIPSEIAKIETIGQRDLVEFEMGFVSQESAEKGAGEEASVDSRISTESVRKALFSPVTILIIVILLLFLIIGYARGADNVILFDKTKSSLYKGHDGRTEFEKNKDGVKKIILSSKAGDRLTAVGITDNSFSRPEILLQGEMPLKEGYFKEKILQERIHLANAWESMIIEADSNCTDVLGAILLSSRLLEQSKKKNLYIFSDMRHVTKSLDLETPNLIPKEFIERVQKKGIIPDLTGVEVWVFGVHPYGKDVVYYRSLQSFWVEYFQRTKAVLKAYSMERRLKNE